MPCILYDELKDCMLILRRSMRAVSQVGQDQAVQGLPKTHLGGDRPGGTRYRHRASQHCHQLRHARGRRLRHISAQSMFGLANHALGHVAEPSLTCLQMLCLGCTGGSVRHQGSGHLIHRVEGGQRRAERGAVTIRGRNHSSPRPARRVALHERIGTHVDSRN